MAQRTDRIHEGDSVPARDEGHKGRKPGFKAIRFFRGYLMTAGALATIYMLARGFVWLCTLIYAWQN